MRWGSCRRRQITPATCCRRPSSRTRASKSRGGRARRMMDFSDLERQVLEDLKDSTHLKAVLEKFCEMKADECRRACTQRWRTYRATRKSRRTTRPRRKRMRRSCRSCWTAEKGGCVEKHCDQSAPYPCPRWTIHAHFPRSLERPQVLASYAMRKKRISEAEKTKKSGYRVFTGGWMVSFRILAQAVPALPTWRFALYNGARFVRNLSD